MLDTLDLKRFREAKSNEVHFLRLGWTILRTYVFGCPRNGAKAWKACEMGYLIGVSHESKDARLGFGVSLDHRRIRTGSTELCRRGLETLAGLPLYRA